MSHVADAMRQARRDNSSADTSTPHDQACSDDLGTGDNCAPPWISEDMGAIDPAIGEAAPSAPAASGERTREFASVRSPLDDLAPAIRHQVAGIVERVFLASSDGAMRMVAFAGVDADARSGWIAAAVADMLAQRTQANVAVVDMNSANPGLHEHFGLGGTQARVENGSETPRATPARRVRENLWVIAAGASAGVSGFTAASRAHISKLAAAYDHVIVSLEPLTAWCGGGLPTMADGIVLVIAADGTRREAGRQVAERLQASGATIIGAVLMNRQYAIPEAIYRRL